jgi:hypothetical protein
VKWAIGWLRLGAGRRARSRDTATGQEADDYCWEVRTPFQSRDDGGRRFMAEWRASGSAIAGIVRVNVKEGSRG